MTRTSLMAAALALALAGCGEDLPTGDPAKSTQMGQFGETLTSEAAIGPRDTKYWFRNLVSDYAEHTPGLPPDFPPGLVGLKVFVASLVAASGANHGATANRQPGLGIDRFVLRSEGHGRVTAAAG